jgi:uncharacterized coiled-coil protein SlyX
MTNEERLANLEDLSGLLVKLARNAHERLDALAEAQANSEAKIAALADAQIRTEVTMETLAARMETLTARVAGLADTMSTMAAAQTHTDQRLDALIDIVRKRFESESQG